jgi:hypothetical protein
MTSKAIKESNGMMASSMILIVGYC